MSLEHNHNIEKRSESLLKDEISEIMIEKKNSGIPPNKIIQFILFQFNLHINSKDDFHSMFFFF